MSAQVKIPAIYMRGGTSRGVFFHRKYLPEDVGAWPSIFLQVIGSPDPYGRQLNGMGVGLSSLSKVVVIGPSSHPEADVDYTFAQIGVGEPTVDFSGICGNLTSAVGHFAVDEGLVEARGDEALVRIYNTNTKKIIHARFPLVNGQAAVEGDFVLDGVAGTGARIRLEFKQPGGAKTSGLLPTGKAVELLQVPGLGEVEASLVDATNPVVIVRAEALGMKGTELPLELEANGELRKNLEAVRAAGGVRMGLAESPERLSREFKLLPFVAMVASPMEAQTLAGTSLAAEAMHLTVRVISNGQAHRATPLTAGMCLAVAARIEGTLAQQASTAPADGEADLLLAHPSGLAPVAATVGRENGSWHVEQVVVYRTARRVMEGSVLLPASVMAEA